ncbi:MAG: peptide chain release factor N(5)-glutamine methyltransferase [Candidatus Omnitrophica bacterium]|nr:peptide chain release factor N(5)-glutamine methyltransferase [Candidatus Omnitrophota bacterium]MDD5660685.1 peptide chain release factor N(5)-glutamine methyltransferase [Candidatus Omnitrophota bacterium]
MNEAELVLTHVLNCDRLSLYINKDSTLGKYRSVLISKILKRRIAGEPLQYILGSSNFMGYEFKVDRRALIPRAETEILVQAAIEELKTMNTACPKVLDLGTGSGCIAVAIAKALPQSIVWATDISKQALQLARENARFNNVDIKFLNTDIFSVLKGSEEKFDLIISNPPYIPVNQLSALAKEISFEPVQALEAGIDGLDFYRRIVIEAPVYLHDNGLLAFEVGIMQSGPVSSMLLKENFHDIRVINDYNNIERVVTGKKRIS